MIPVSLEIGDLLTVGNGVDIMVVGLDGGAVQLEIVAPRHNVTITRKKVMAKSRWSETKRGKFVDLVKGT